MPSLPSSAAPLGGLPAGAPPATMTGLPFRIIGESLVFLRALDRLRRVAFSDAPVLIEGETGSGKEVAARAVHYGGARRAAPFVPLNCGALPDALFEAEIAAAWPERVEAAVLSAPAFADAAFRARRAQPSRIDNVTPSADGSHLTALWRIRQPWHPEGDIDLLERFVIDAVKAGPRAAEGHAVVARYVMEARLPLIRCPVLVIAPTADPHAYPQARPLADAIKGSRYVEIEGGMVPLPDQMPARFAQVVMEFLDAQR